MKKRSIYLALMLLCTSSLYALGLGEIHVYSHLNEPLSAEIPLLDIDDIPTKSIEVRFASQSAFEQYDLKKSSLLSKVRLAIKRNHEGNWVVALSSKQNISRAYLALVIELVSPEGEAYYPFSILLDPLDDEPKADNTSSQAIIQSKTNASWFNKPEPKDSAASTEQSKTYGPTLADESIYQIAKRYQPDDLPLSQVILAIVGKNPDAFEEGNLNGLKLASRLKIPDTEDMESVPSNLAAQEVQQHDVAWRKHQSIEHRIMPPYMHIQAVTTAPLTSVIPKISLKAIKAQAVDPVWEGKIKRLEQMNEALTQSLQRREQENQNLSQKLDDLGSQFSQLKTQFSQPGMQKTLTKNPEKRSHTGLWLAALAVISLAWWLKRRWHARPVALLNHQPHLLDVEAETTPEPKPPAPKKPKPKATPKKKPKAASEKKKTSPKSDKAKTPKSKAALDVLLDLAKTYISRGNTQAAKQGLEEVLSCGSAKQKAQARALLDKLP